MKAFVRMDAPARYWRWAMHGRPNSMGATRDEFRYKAALDQLAGKEVFLVSLSAGVSESYYVVADTSYAGRPAESRVVALMRCWFEAFQPEIESPLAPLSREHQQFKMFAKQHGIGTVKVLTAWTDGFCAFRPLTDKEKEEFA